MRRIRRIKAISSFERPRILPVIPASADVRNNLGIALMGEGKRDEAIAEFREALKVEPDSVKAHRLCDLPNVASGLRTESPVRFIDTAGAGYEEEEVNDSRRNTQEAAVVAKQVRVLLNDGLLPEQIAVRFVDRGLGFHGCPSFPASGQRQA